MADTTIPFYTQAAILDGFIHAKSPVADPVTLDVLLDILKSRIELRVYFFRNRPSLAWLPILWEGGFFDAPPEPVEGVDGPMRPYWDVQTYLFSVAADAPEYVLRHINTIDAHPVYIAQAVHCLAMLQVPDIEKALPRLLEWLHDYDKAIALTDPCWEIVKILAVERCDSALALFNALMRPFPNPRVTELNGRNYNTEAVSILKTSRFQSEEFQTVLSAMSTINIERLASILETSLLQTLQVEAEACDSDFPFSSWWRRAIEPSNQNSHRDFKEKLLDFLRDVLEQWSTCDQETFAPRIASYLDGEHKILRRLGLHIMRVCPHSFHDLLTQTLLNRSNYDETTIHHEFLRLLEDGFKELSPTDQDIVVGIIMDGPPRDRLRKMAEWAHETHGSDKEEYATGYSRRWIIQRLWMLKGQMQEQGSAALDRLVSESGEPEHPEFLGWSSGIYRVSEVSPLSIEQLATYHPNELVVFLRQWEPETDLRRGPENVSKEGLAPILATLIISQLEKYLPVLLDLCSIHPQYTSTFLRLVTERAKGDAFADPEWNIYINLCEGMLQNDEIRTSTTRSSLYAWQDIRLGIVHLIEVVLDKPHCTNQTGMLDRIRNLLMCLLDDPDPNQEKDGSEEAWHEHDDPNTMALNHVRPAALTCFIKYALFIAKQCSEVDKDDGVPERLEPVVRDMLTAKLHDTSLAVRSVFGRFLVALHWLDRTWLTSHLPELFPACMREEDIASYVAVWDSYVLHNKVYPDVFVTLRPYYEQAILNLKWGDITKSHLQPVQRFASHLIFNYFELDTDEAQLRDTLLHRFFNHGNAEQRSQGAWMFWQYCQGYVQTKRPRSEWWPAAKAFWRDRVASASSQNFPSDFDEEMEWFAELLEFDIVPKKETLKELWPLLQGMLPYVAARGARHRIWTTFEAFLSKRVDRDPERSIELYAMMNERSARPMWMFPDEPMEHIIERATADVRSRKRALALIDLLARRGELRFRDLYERYAR